MTVVVDLTLALSEAIDKAVTASVAKIGGSSAASDWRERLWTCDSQTRLSAEDVAEALGLSVRSVYRLVADKGLPCRKRDEVYVFIAGDVREWLSAREEIVNGAVVPLRRRR